MQVIRVRIRKAPNDPQCWYYARVGEVFEVYEFRKDFTLKEDYDRGHDAEWRYIDKSDCIVLAPPSEIQVLKAALHGAVSGMNNVPDSQRALQIELIRGMGNVFEAIFDAGEAACQEAQDGDDDDATESNKLADDGDSASGGAGAGGGNPPSRDYALHDDHALYDSDNPDGCEGD